MTETPNAPQKSTRDRIAAELVRIVSRNGTAGASVRRITKAAGCNESVLYDHFENKAVMQKTVFDEIADRRDAMYASVVARNQGGSARDLIMDWTRTTLEFFDEDPDTFAFIDLISPSVIADDQKRVRDVFDQMRSNLTRFETRPDEQIDASPVAFAITHKILLGAAIEIHAGTKEGPSAPLAEELAETLISILVRRTGDPPMVTEPEPPIGAGPRRGMHGPDFMREDSTRARLMAATARIVAEQGVEAATVRAISSLAKCHDTDLYSKFRNKQSLLHTVHGEILDHWYALRSTFGEANRQDAKAFVEHWAKAALLSFDREPETFAYVLLTYPPVTEDLLDSHAFNIANGIQLFSGLTPPPGHRVDLSPQNYLAFRSAMIAIPRAINAGLVAGPAVRHTESLQRVACRILIRPLD
ncbi:MAG: hypothetical protein CMJ27_03075 [Phycisphaerae bacterium]|nr:hypothetical protein [Phycisphaerae bacterium]